MPEGELRASIKDPATGEVIGRHTFRTPAGRNDAGIVLPEVDLQAIAWANGVDDLKSVAVPQVISGQVARHGLES